MSSASPLQGSGIVNNQAPAATLGGSAAKLQNPGSVSVLQQSASSEVSVVGYKVDAYQDTSYLNIVLLVVIAAALVAGVIVWFRDSK